jgi:hypothetical protein
MNTIPSISDRMRKIGSLKFREPDSDSDSTSAGDIKESNAAVKLLRKIGDRMR